MRRMWTVLLLSALAGVCGAGARAAEVLVLDDRFDDNAGGWWVGDDGNVAASIQAGRMRLERRISGGWASWRNARVHQEGGYRIEGTVTIVADEDRYGCGLWFGSRDGNNGYVFEAGALGQYRFFHYEDGKWVDETSWQPSPAVRKGVGATNTLAVLKQGAQWSLYINDQYVNQVPARAFFGQKVGFRIEGRMACEVDRLRVTEDEGPRAPPTIAVGAYPGPGERLLLDEPFDRNTRGWPLGPHGKGSLALENGKLQVRHQAKGGFERWIDAGLDPFADHRIELSLRVLEDQDNYGCGLWFGAQDSNNGYAFEVSDDGFYRQFRFEGGVFHDETGWQKHPAVRTGLGSLNHLTLVKRERFWLLYVNGTLVDRVQARPPFGGGLGVRVEGGLACELDHLRVVESAGELPPEAPMVNVLGPASLQDGAPRPRVEEPAAAAARVVAVFEVLDSSNRLSKQERSDLTEYLMARLTARGGYAVVPTDTLKQSLTETKKDSYKDCYDTACQITLGKAVAAELVLTTKLLRVAGECAITATLFDVKKETTVKAATLDTRCEMKGLLDALKELVKQL